MRRAEPVLAVQTWPDLVGDEARILVMPVGSVEQHGPHLPLGTDTIIATALAERLVASHDRLVLAPALSVGASGEHRGFPGILSIGTEVLADVLTEVVRSARPWTSGVVFVSGHGGNAAALERARVVAELEGDAVCVVTAASPDADAHAGRAETSLMLFLEPSAVRQTEAMAGETRALGEIIGELRAAGVAGVSPNGVLGDPTGATREEGAGRIDAMCATGLARIAERFGP